MKIRLVTPILIATVALTLPLVSNSAEGARNQEEAAVAENPLIPSAADMQKAREDRAKGIIPPSYDKETKIEAVRDQNNRVTEYVVTPGSTHIPYTMDNQADRPIDSTPGGNSKSTLGTTKFIEIGW